ncbi:KAP95 Karyopherin importin beta [Pyrenophora tritici-repentis]|uniref:Importin protein n=1 Tax=Pyrenophora tritici-repentis TaxID=45151 RepID=A0A2W1GA27_9PLEO|nr:Importin subunit beta-3 [Pyrenophora tritici-repentis]KAF7451503.1 Importin protein [Pyrenophora tritici-repentis]KAF7575386.1 KAP95, Karyopherin (importin) beta [Pyrenophora tritici-repentis]KAG9385863.1 Importin protein [Pyrenophora tritici-repentis]KAI0578938.1 Importin subunit beta-3 [Pyrenophora tritici-repentis]
MSVLPPEVHTALATLLQGLQSPDNVQRATAEQQLNEEWVNQRPDVLLMGLSEQIELAQDTSTRTFAAVIFRRQSSKPRKAASGQTADLFLTLNPAEREAIRAKLLQCLANEADTSVRTKVGDAVAELARQHTDEGVAWPELLGALFQASQSQDAPQRENAFRIFSTTPQIIEKQHEDVVMTAFKGGFGDSESSVRIAAVEAFASFFRSITKKAQSKYYSLIGEILNILPPIKDSGDADLLTKALISLIDLAEVAPKMFKPLFNSLVQFSISVIQDKDLGETARQNALELMATFADNAPVMCKKDANFTNDMVTQCLSLMTDVGADDDDAEEWNVSEDLDEESDSNHVAGEQCMDRLANKLGGQAILPPTFNWLPRMMTSSAWRDRHAALMAISAISEGCRELMVGELDKVLDLVLPALRDPHPRVRWAACNAVGQMSTDFAGTMQEKYHQVVLPNIIPVLESSEPRVQAHAAAALVNFCEEAEKNILEPYLDQLLNHLLMLLQSPKRFVQEQALSTIATVADSAEAAFSKYYDTLMPLLFNVLQEEQSKEYRLLRAKAMECATLIALAVGKDRMGQDALSLVQLLGRIQNSVSEPDDPQASYLLHCWGRMCRVLGREFVPFLAGVIPPLTELAGAKADIQLLDDEDQVAQIQDEEGWELVPLKGKVIGIKTSILDDKHMAIELIVIYAQVLEDAFEPYVNDIMDKIALPGLAFFFHDPVRVASAKCVPMLLNAYKKAHGPESTQLGQLWERTVERVLEVLSAEPAIDTLAEMYQCFYECLECIGQNCLTNAHMTSFVESARGVLEDYNVRVKERLEEQADNEDGEEASEETLFAIEDDQNLLSDMNKAFHSIFKTMGTAFLSHWASLIEFYGLAVVNPDPTQRQWAICIYDDVLEFCGPESWQYKDHIIQPLIDGMQDDVPANRQAAVYGVGVAAHKGGENWSEFVAASLPMLFQVTQRPNARADDDIFATENASAAIAKILHYNSSKVQNWDSVAAAWVDTLPITNDEEATPYAYAFLAQLIEQQNQTVFSQPAKVFNYVVQALEAETLQGQTANRVVISVKALIQATSTDLSQAAATLTPEQQRTAQVYFS